ncbi:MAG: hypothetical protein RL154_1357, partial [Pseudomonadota bacterium]
MDFVTPTIFGVPLAYMAYKRFLHVDSQITENGFRLTNNVNDMPSFPNPAKIQDGYGWATPRQLKRFSQKQKEFAEKNNLATVVFDFFKYDDRTAQNAKISPYRRKKAESTSISLSSLSFARMILGIGTPGSGKTQFIWYLLNQNKINRWFNRAIIHDAKSEFTEILLDCKEYFTINFYDERGIVWDFFAEKEFDMIVKMFVENMINSVFGGEKGANSFFTQSSFEKIIEFFTTIKYKYPNVTDSKKLWVLLIAELRKYIAYVESLTTKSSDTDVKNTLLLVIKSIEILAYRIVNGAKTFTLEKFYQG